MELGDFAHNPHVQAFLAWARELPPADWRIAPSQANQGHYPLGADQQRALRALPPIMVDLNIRHSRFVPGGLRARAPLGALSALYVWQTPHLVAGDFETTAIHLHRLGWHLRGAVDANDAPAVLAACRDALLWGGVRNWTHGAWPLLVQLDRDGCLVSDLHTWRQALALNHARLDDRGDLPRFPYMNSMLTKVFSLMASDGLPIYDSRVGAAIGTVIEVWRQSTGQATCSLAPELRFPSIPPSAARSPRARFPGCLAPGQLIYGGKTSPAQWAGAKVRLGWLLQLLLGGGSFEEQADSMRALEACLFMAGYDCSGIARPLPGARAGLQWPRAA